MGTAGRAGNRLDVFSGACEARVALGICQGLFEVSVAIHGSDQRKSACHGRRQDPSPEQPTRTACGCGEPLPGSNLPRCNGHLGFGKDRNRSASSKVRPIPEQYNCFPGRWVRLQQYSVDASWFPSLVSKWKQPDDDSISERKGYGLRLQRFDANNLRAFSTVDGQKLVSSVADDRA